VLILSIKHIRDTFYTFLVHYIGKGLALNTANETLTLTGDTIFGFAILFAPIALVQTTEAYQPIFIIIITFILAQFGFSATKESYDRNTLVLRIIGIVSVIAGSALMVLNN
jgi:hypothetical protein